MQEACEANPSGMVSVLKLSPADCEAIAAETGCAVTNYNAAAQTVLGGTHEQVAAAAAAATAKGGRAIVLKTAGAYHSPFMAPAAEKLAPVLAAAELRAPGLAPFRFPETGVSSQNMRACRGPARPPPEWAALQRTGLPSIGYNQLDDPYDLLTARRRHRAGPAEHSSACWAGSCRSFAPQQRRLPPGSAVPWRGSQRYTAHPLSSA